MTVSEQELAALGEVMAWKVAPGEVLIGNLRIDYAGWPTVARILLGNAYTTVG